MDRKNETMIVQGYSGKRKKAIKQEQSFSDSKNSKTFGMPITSCTFWEMLRNFKDAPASESTEFKGLSWVEFSKASIFRILSQENCDYIRFYFVVPDLDTKKASLMMQGVNNNGISINWDTLLNVAEIMDKPEYNLNNERDEDAILQKLNKLDPPLEERGNGGEDSTLVEEKNIHSINDFYNAMDKKGLPIRGMDLPTFAKEFLEYADGQSSIK